MKREQVEIEKLRRVAKLKVECGILNSLAHLASDSSLYSGSSGIWRAALLRLTRRPRRRLAPFGSLLLRQREMPHVLEQFQHPCNLEIRERLAAFG